MPIISCLFQCERCGIFIDGSLEEHQKQQHLGAYQTLFVDNNSDLSPNEDTESVPAGLVN